MNKKLIVNPLAITITIDDAEKVYGESDPEFTSNAADVVIGNDKIDFEIVRKHPDQEDAKLYAKELDGVLGNANVNKNYTITFVPGNFNIKKAPAKGLELVAEGLETVYDGEKHSITATYAVGLTKPTTLSYSIDGTSWGTNPEFTNVVDGQKVFVKAENDNFETATAEATVTITKRPVKVVAGKVDADVQEFLFDGKPHTAEGYYVVDATEDTGLVQGQTLTAELENNIYTKMGDYEFNIKEDSVAITTGLLIKDSVTDNYKIETVLGAMRIKSRKGTGEEYPVTIKADDVQVVYNGKVQTYTTGYGVSSDTEDVSVVAMIWDAITNFFTLKTNAATGVAFNVDGTDYTLSGVEVSASGKAVSSYKFIATGTPEVTMVIDGEDYDVTDEFAINYELGNLIITPAKVTVTATTGLTKNAGTADPAFTATVVAENTALNAEALETVRYTVARAAGEDAGTYDVIPTGDQFQGNFDVTYVNGTFTINAVAADITDDPTPSAPTPSEPEPAPVIAPAAVLGAQRELEAPANEGAVLGARRGRTDDETASREARVFAIVVSAAVAITLMLKGKKKEEDEA